MWSDFVRSAVQVTWSVAGATLLSYWTERERLQLRASRRSATRKIIRLKSFFLEPRVCDHLDEVGLTERFRRSRKPVFFLFLFLFLLSPLIWNPFKFCQWLQSHDEPGSASVRARLPESVLEVKNNDLSYADVWKGAAEITGGMNGRLSPLQSDMKGKDSSDRPSEWIIPLRCQCNFIIQWAFEWVRCHTISLLENVLLCIIDQTNTSRLRLGNKGTVWQGVMLHVVSSSSFRLYVLIKCTEKNKQQSQISSSQFIYWINLDKKHQNLFFFFVFF